MNAETKRAPGGQFTKGHTKVGGRGAGVQNKTSTEIKQAIELVFDEIGGIPAFAAWAEANPTTFYTALWGKLLPTAVKIEASTVDFVSTLEKARMRAQSHTMLVGNGGTKPLEIEPSRGPLALELSTQGEVVDSED